MSATRAREIFIELVAQVPPEQWDARLAELAGEDRALRDKVAGLLAAHRQADSFLEQPAAPLGGTVDEPSGLGSAGAAAAPGGTEQPGAVLAGRYKLLEAIGEGGMGSVWMAQQTAPVKRPVAVKLIKVGMDSKQVLARFEAERQALALMDHPNIAKVLDAGETPPAYAGGSPRPFFVMELVKGVPITRYCDEHRLTPRQRLELFVPVCQAIQHAHHKGIIHRDIKPSNVLVALYDERPVPKVIDFGVAKATGQQLTEQTLHTGFGAVVGTVEYMSPEQASFNQLDVDTRSDIYSLGVLLYELLAGSPPFSRKELEKAGMMEMLRVIREQEPSKPSTKLSTAEGLPTLAANRGTEPAKLTRLVRGELDWIVMKSLEKDRRRRYETANGFAMDVQRYLADEPVLACPPSAWYRLGKATRRHKVGLAVAGMILLFVVLLGSGAGWAVRDRAAREADRERERTGRLAKVAGQVELILAEVERLEKEEQWSEALAEARRAEAALAGAEADPDTHDRVRQVLTDLEMVARLEEIRLKQSELKKGHFDRAGADPKYAEAFRAFGIAVETLSAEEATEKLSRRPIRSALAAALDDWARIRRFKPPAGAVRWQDLLALARAADPDPGRNRLREALERGDKKPLVDLVNAYLQKPNLPPATLDFLAWALWAAGAEDKALAVLRQAQQQYPEDFWLNNDLGYHLAALLNPAQAGEATRFFTAAVALRPRSASAHTALGAVLAEQKKLDQAIVCHQKAIELDPTYAMPQNNLGNALKAQGKLDQAIACYEKAIELDPKYAMPHYNLGNTRKTQGKLDQAIAHYEKSIELDQNYAPAHKNLGNVLLDQNKLDRAIACFRQAIALDPNDWGPHANLGVALSRQGKLEEAIHEFSEAVNLNPDHAGLHEQLGRALSEKGRRDAAIAEFRAAVTLREKLVGELPTAPEHRQQLAGSYTDLASALEALGRGPEALTAYRAALTLEEKLAAEFPALPQYRQELAKGHYHVGDLLAKLGQRPAALESCRAALTLQKKLVAESPAVPQYRQELARTYNRLAVLLGTAGKSTEATAASRKALALQEQLVADFPAVADYRLDLGGDYCNMGNWFRGNKQAAASLDWYAKSIAVLEPIVRKEPANAAARLFLRNARWNRALALTSLDRYTEALPDWDRAVELTEPKERPSFRADRAMVRIRAGKVEEGIAEAAELAKIQGIPAAVLYDLACVYAVASAKDPARKDDYAGRAVALLRQAVEVGYRDVAVMKEDTDLDPLRGREDFQKLLAELTKK